MKGRKGQEGVALLLAVLFVVLLTALVVEYTYETRVESAQVAANLNDFRATVAARSAIASGVSLLTADMYGLGESATSPVGAGTSSSSSAAPTAGSGSEYDGFDETWAQGVPYDMVNEAVMQCTISDEYGKLNLNALASPDTGEPNLILMEVLRALFANRGALEDPVDAIVDWVDPDDEEMPGGAESSYYQGLEVPYACKNAPFSCVEEL
ncbi:MAG: general secretion pathway protein GspK, partial [bacterium]|nr:general secretion pathway protein GspK [bacterium]